MNVRDKVNKMKSINVLISTMNRKNLDFFKKMNVFEPSIIVNQKPNSDNNIINIIDKGSLKFINVKDRGISNSRNLLLDFSNSDISVIADDDLIYEDNFGSVIREAYEHFDDADVTVFQVPRVGKNSNIRAKNYSKKARQLNYLTSMKVSAVEITFRTKSIKNNNIKFNPNIGAGTDFMMGEENQFLFDCLRAGLKIIYLPYKIATVNVSESTWFRGYNRDYFISTGAKFYNMSNIFYLLLIFQFALRKKKLYKEKFSTKQVLKFMLEGVRLYKERFK